MTESIGPVGESMTDVDEASWHPVGRETAAASQPAGSLRATARRLVRTHPHARNLLRLLEVYAASVDPRPAVQPRAGQTLAEHEAHLLDRLWTDFLAKNATHWSPLELARRTWRDGECFVRRFAGEDASLPAVRFIDPERIGPVPGIDSHEGIISVPHDAETPQQYLRLTADGRLAERIDAADLLHVRIGCDSNELRGRSLLEPLAQSLQRYDDWLEIELQARKLQASIVLWRKVTGSGFGGGQSSGDAATAGVSPGAGSVMAGVGREEIGAGTILTTGPSTELQFLQPQTNFGDAVPLGRMLLLAAAAGAGLPEFMLTADAANANFASTMVAEGPAVKLFQSHQRWLGGELTRMWRWVMQTALENEWPADEWDAKKPAALSADLLDRVTPRWIFPELVSRDRPAERGADVRLIEAGVLSRAEVGRRDGVDPELMRQEVAGESSTGE